MNTVDHDIFFTTLVIGDTCVGKMKFIKSYTDEKYKNIFDNDSRFKLLTCDGLKIKLLLKKYFDRPSSDGGSNTTVYRNTQCFLVMFDVCDFDSFQGIKLWIREIVTFSKHGTPIIVIGNKIDLKDNRKVQMEQVLELIEQIKENFNLKFQIPYFEISSLQPDSSQFKKIFKTIYLLTSQRFNKPITNINNATLEDKTNHGSSEEYLTKDDGKELRNKRKSKILNTIISIFK
ncbi:hypothetical protein RB653_006421 [Dictyostelium firmibasis]|uniref:Rab GTPase n=1 Tax=Dictyostelium firmibasis TaxID=79012 RepID=A0AAN7U2Q1_9MYCE